MSSGVRASRPGSALRRLTRVDVWNVGVVDAPIHAFLEPGFRPRVAWFPVGRRPRLAADPFALEDGGRTFVLYEALDYPEGRGYLVARELGDGGPGPEQLALRLPHHLSYPFLLREGGETWCVPESFEAGEVALYRAVDFPRRWERAGALLPDLPGIDSTPVRWRDRWWCFTTRKGDGHDRKLLLYHADELRGPWTPHAGNPVKVDVRSARGAGTPFVHAGVLYRPAQDYSRTVEGRITVNRVTRLDARGFEEEPVAVIEPFEGPWGDKVHTLSAAGERTLVDGCRETHVLRHPALLAYKLRRILARLRPGKVPGAGQ